MRLPSADWLVRLVVSGSGGLGLCGWKVCFMVLLGDTLLVVYGGNDDVFYKLFLQNIRCYIAVNQ